MRRIATRALWVVLVVALAVSRSPDRGVIRGHTNGPTTRRDPAERWDRFFASIDADELDDPRWKPNALLVEGTRGLEPGRALDIGVGQGRNALYLAEQGWRVTGFDISAEALRLAQLQARDRGVELELERADFGRYEYGVERWDLIVGIYVHEHLVVRAEQIKRSLAPGGLLVVEGFVESEELAARGSPKLGFKPDTLLDAYADLEILRYEQVRAPADWAPGEVLPIVRLVARKQST